MKMAINLKKIVPLMVLFALIVGVLNLGSYDPRNEMSVLSPNIASATWWGNNDDCEIWTADQELYVGSDAVLEWWVEDGYNNITINGESVSGNSHTFKNLQNDTTFKLVAINDEGEKCTSKVKIECLPVPPPVCTFSPEWTTVYSGESATLEWTSTNAVSAFISGGIGEVSVNGSYDTGPLYEDKWYTLTVTNSEGETVECMSDIEVKPQPTVPTCDSFIADPSSIFRGSSTDLVWSTSNATRVVIDNAIGEASLDNRFSVTPLQSTLYTLTAFGEDGQQAVCTAEVTVKEPPVENVPQCLSFTASTSNLSAGGGDSTLEWTTSNATNVTIEPGIGNVDLNGSRLVNLTENTTYTLTASDNNSEDTCSTTITIEEPEPEPSSITCEANVDFSSSPKSLTKGESATLSWSTTDITEISFDNNIVATGLSGSVSVTPDVSTSYLLTATDGVDTISCPVTVSVSEPPRTTGGGGGGGSSSPKCELSISDSKIERGEEIELTWDSTRAGEVIIVDSDGETIITTEDLLGSKKDELYDGSITLFPT